MTVAFPLQMSANHRYFMDQNNVPFLVVADSPQSLSVKCTPTEQDTFFANRISKGFNSMLIDLIASAYTGGNADGKTYSGVAPFTTGTNPDNYDLSTPNETYFALMDTMINLAASYDICVFLDPIETGDWLNTLEFNGSTKSYNYGVYVGDRYKDFPNIIWFHGNDFNNGRIPGNSDNALVGQVVDGIRSVDSNHLHTILLGRPDFATNSDVYANEDTDLSDRWGCDATYTFSATANVTLTAYNSTPVTPVFLGESNYEFENLLAYAGGATNARRIRAQNYGALTWGSIGGILYGSTYTYSSTWMSDIPNRLNTPAAAQIAYINSLMLAAGSWWNLVPDQTHAVMTAGYGSAPANNTDPAVATYCTASVNSNTLVAFCPASATLTIAMSYFPGSVTAKWFDPTNGSFSTISGSPFTNSGTHNFVTPGNNTEGSPDWLLLLQSEQIASLRLDYRLS